MNYFFDFRANKLTDNGLVEKLDDLIRQTAQHPDETIGIDGIVVLLESHKTGERTSLASPNIITEIEIIDTRCIIKTSSTIFGLIFVELIQQLSGTVIGFSDITIATDYSYCKRQGFNVRLNTW